MQVLLLLAPSVAVHVTVFAPTLKVSPAEPGVQETVGLTPESSVAVARVYVTDPEVEPLSNPVDTSAGQVTTGGVVSKEKQKVIFSLQFWYGILIIHGLSYFQLYSVILCVEDRLFQ